MASIRIQRYMSTLRSVSMPSMNPGTHKSDEPKLDFSAHFHEILCCNPAYGLKSIMFAHGRKPYMHFYPDHRVSNT